MAEQITKDVLVGAFEEALKRNNSSANGSDGGEGGERRQVVTDSQISGGDGSGTDARVTQDELSRREVVLANTAKILYSQTTGKDIARSRDTAEDLILGGAYGDKVARSYTRGSGDYYSTIVDEDGAFLLPTVVRNEIEALMDQVGAARQVANVFANATGEFKAPAASGAQQSMKAVGEGGEMTVSKRAFRAVKLNPQKWGSIFPWTYEAQIEIGARIMADLNRAIAIAASRAEDEAMINGDGTSTYNGIDGLFSTTRTGTADGNDVGQQTLVSGSTAPSDISPDEIVFARNQIDTGARRVSELAYIFHPDMEVIFLTRKDDNGAYIFDYIQQEGVSTLKGIPVYYTEALPANEDVTAGQDFGLLVNGRFWQMATGEQLSTQEAREGTARDADTGETINLFTQDLRALKVRHFFDMDANFNTAFAKFTTAAS